MAAPKDSDGVPRLLGDVQPQLSGRRGGHLAGHPIEAAPTDKTLIVRQWAFSVPGHWPCYSDIRALHGGQAEKKRWQRDTEWRAKIAKVGRCESIYIRYRHRRANKRADKSNLAAAAMKIVEDALVNVDVIPDDRWDYIAGFAHDYLLTKDEGLDIFVIDMGKITNP